MQTTLPSRLKLACACTKVQASAWRCWWSVTRPGIPRCCTLRQSSSILVQIQLSSHCAPGLFQMTHIKTRYLMLLFGRVHQHNIRISLSSAGLRAEAPSQVCIHVSRSLYLSLNLSFWSACWTLLSGCSSKGSSQKVYLQQRHQRRRQRSREHVGLG